MFNIEKEMIPFFITATLLTVIFIFFLIASLVHLRSRQIRKERELLHALIGERERTMETISAEIHDNINQMLYLGRMALKMIKKHSVPQQEKYITESENILDSVIGDLKNISHSLNSDYLKNRGLYESLIEEVNWVNTTKKLNCSIEQTGDLRYFLPDTELMIIRIAQEAIHNSLKHAHAQQLQIQLDYGKEEFRMSITDDGSGFSMEPGILGAGIGLQNIYRRSRIINAHIEVKSAIGKGTQIILTIPMPVSIGSGHTGSGPNMC